MAQLSTERRAEYLSHFVAEAIKVGWRPESVTTHAAHMVRGRRCNHPFHLVVAILTCGGWLPFWLVYAVVIREQRSTLTVGRNGECCWSQTVDER